MRAVLLVSGDSLGDHEPYGEHRTPPPPIATHNPFANRLAKAIEVRTEEMVIVTPPEFDLILAPSPTSGTTAS